MLDDNEPFEMLPVPQVKYLASANTEQIDRALAEYAPKIEYKLFGNGDVSNRKRVILQFYCVHDGDVFGAMCRLSQKDNAMLRFLQYLVLYRVEGHHRMSVIPGLLGRLVRQDPWIDWITVSPEYAMDRVKRSGRH